MGVIDSDFDAVNAPRSVIPLDITIPINIIAQVENRHEMHYFQTSKQSGLEMSGFGPTDG